ncbi:TPA: metallophosphoesterase [Streptococcus suis]|nr:serine/threonine protein phosphatase [Streptococcus suis]NQO11249.1 serine/threonine protein phosphatase [Streptococcus suis]NQO16946.1 serine/threonine protein phosphatase [Streptococcus suis]NQO70345.1 serine/threonine protein phosphatase [Streptococcus suis]NQQ86083.1 serine/threonine protein phosphatase [Streptococcus suis]
MKTLLVGDLHLKSQIILPIVDNVIKDNNVTRVIFLGDYVDFPGQTNNINLYARDLTFLFSWKKNMEANGLEVINIIGNHDADYLINFVSQYSVKNLEVFFAIKEQLKELGLQVAYQLSDFLISHAGYTTLFNPEPWHFEKITSRHLHKLEELADSIGTKRGGLFETGSPLWADLSELKEKINLKHPKQIVGHTPQKNIDASNNIIGIDTFSLYLNNHHKYQVIGNGDLIIHDDKHNELTVISTNWGNLETYETLKKLIQ